MDTDGAAADLVAIADDVVRVREPLLRIVAAEGFQTSCGAVNAWCTAVQAPAPTVTSPAAIATLAGSNRASTTQQNAQAFSSMSSTRRPISSRVAPSSDCAKARGPAAKKMQSRRTRPLRSGRFVPIPRGSWLPARRARQIR